MTVTLKSIINEISALTIEWTPKQRAKLNLFEEDPDPGLKINSFGSVCQYRMHLDKYYVSAKREIEDEISHILDSKISIIKLEEYRFKLNETMQLYLPENMNLILGSLVVKIPLFKADTKDLVLKQKLEIFVAELKQLINRLVEFIRHKIRIFKKLILPYENHHPNQKNKSSETLSKQGTLFPDNDIVFPKLFWNKSDTDLLELVLALVESNSVTTEVGAVKQNMAIRFCELLFNRQIKFAHIKIHKLGDRLKDETRFMWKLDNILMTRKQRLEQEKDKRR
jgi:hypothetical protein